MLKRLLLATAIAGLVCDPALAATPIPFTPGSGGNLGGITCGSYTCPQTTPLDSGGGDVTNPTNHSIFTEMPVSGRLTPVPVTISTTSATTLVAAPGAGLYSYVTDLDCSNHGQYTFTLTVANSTAVALYTFDVPAGGGWVKGFVTPLGGSGNESANTALTITATQTSGTGQTPSISCNVQGRARNF